MLRLSDDPLLSEFRVLDDDPSTSDPGPEWFLPGLVALRREAEDADGTDSLGFRSLIERPEVLRKAWIARR